jgi:Cu+-exporting ATPase
MNQIDWQVEGMDCSNCAISIRKFLEKKGMQAVSVNSIDGKVLFSNEPNLPLSELKSGIESLGYQVVSENKTTTEIKKKWLHNNKQRFLFTVPFTAVLMLHMFHLWLPVHWLNNSWLQLILCLPVFILGMKYFGKSGLNSLLNGIPNMNVLVALGALVSFVYSIVGAFILQDNQYLFFETTASIITLVFLGNYLEESSMQATQKSLKSLTKAQKIMANMIAFDGDHQELIFPIENTQLKTGDLILIKTGEQVPIDCKILWGDCAVDESIITGESLPISKTKKDFLIGGSLLEEGSVKAIVTATGNETVLSGIVKMVQQAQSEKPPMQKLADRISAIFVPTVIGIAIVVFLINYFFVDVALNDAIMRAIAVLVISCPCAMGLATPAAISVGLGRAAKKGIIYRNASTLELFKSIRQIVFDKTGTLTTGKFAIQQFETTIDEKEFMSIVFSMEKYSTHPIAQSIVNAWSKSTLIRWKQIEEIKGIGIKAVDEQNNVFEIGSKKILSEMINADAHHLYLLKNKAIIGWIDVMDEIRPEAKNVIEWFNTHDIETIMLTGDLDEKANAVAKALNIKHVYSEQSPSQKMQQIERLSLIKPTAMVGDGINDAPALAKSTIGISIGNASQLALQQSDVVLLNQGLSHLPEAMGLGKHTYLTIKQNLFWAFAYNIIAIPIAAVGLLTPTFSALAMGFSDVMLAIISLNLFVKKVI